MIFAVSYLNFELNICPRNIEKLRLNVDLFNVTSFFHVKMRSPNQGLGSIPASKKWGSGSDPRVHNMRLRD